MAYFNVTINVQSYSTQNHAAGTQNFMTMIHYKRYNGVNTIVSSTNVGLTTYPYTAVNNITILKSDYDIGNYGIYHAFSGPGNIYYPGGANITQLDISSAFTSALASGFINLSHNIQVPDETSFGYITSIQYHPTALQRYLWVGYKINNLYWTKGATEQLKITLSNLTTPEDLIYVVDNSTNTPTVITYFTNTYLSTLQNFQMSFANYSGIVDDSMPPTSIESGTIQGILDLAGNSPEDIQQYARTYEKDTRTSIQVTLYAIYTSVTPPFPTQGTLPPIPSQYYAWVGFTLKSFMWDKKTTEDMQVTLTTTQQTSIFVNQPGTILPSSQQYVNQVYQDTASTFYVGFLNYSRSEVDVTLPEVADMSTVINSLIQSSINTPNVIQQNDIFFSGQTSTIEIRFYSFYTNSNVPTPLQPDLPTPTPIPTPPGAPYYRWIGFRIHSYSWPLQNTNDFKVQINVSPKPNAGDGISDQLYAYYQVGNTLPTTIRYFPHLFSYVSGDQISISITNYSTQTQDANLPDTYNVPDEILTGLDTDSLNNRDSLQSHMFTIQKVVNQIGASVSSEFLIQLYVFNNQNTNPTPTSQSPPVPTPIPIPPTPTEEVPFMAQVIRGQQNDITSDALRKFQKTDPQIQRLQQEGNYDGVNDLMYKAKEKYTDLIRENIPYGVSILDNVDNSDYIVKTDFANRATQQDMNNINQAIFDQEMEGENDPLDTKRNLNWGWANKPPKFNPVDITERYEQNEQRQKSIFQESMGFPSIPHDQITTLQSNSGFSKGFFDRYFNFPGAKAFPGKVYQRQLDKLEEDQKKNAVEIQSRKDFVQELYEPFYKAGLIDDNFLKEINDALDRDQLSYMDAQYLYGILHFKHTNPNVKTQEAVDYIFKNDEFKQIMLKEKVIYNAVKHIQNKENLSQQDADKLTQVLLQGGEVQNLSQESQQLLDTALDVFSKKQEGWMEWAVLLAPRFIVPSTVDFIQYWNQLPESAKSVAQFIEGITNNVGLDFLRGMVMGSIGGVSGFFISRLLDPSIAQRAFYSIGSNIVGQQFSNNLANELNVAMYNAMALIRRAPAAGIQNVQPNWILNRQAPQALMYQLFQDNQQLAIPPQNMRVLQQQFMALGDQRQFYDLHHGLGGEILPISQIQSNFRHIINNPRNIGFALGMGMLIAIGAGTYQYFGTDYKGAENYLPQLDSTQKSIEQKYFTDSLIGRQDVSSQSQTGKDILDHLLQLQDLKEYHDAIEDLNNRYTVEDSSLRGKEKQEVQKWVEEDKKYNKKPSQQYITDTDKWNNDFIRGLYDAVRQSNLNVLNNINNKGKIQKQFSVNGDGKIYNSNTIFLSSGVRNRLKRFEAENQIKKQRNYFKRRREQKFIDKNM